MIVYGDISGVGNYLLASHRGAHGRPRISTRQPHKGEPHKWGELLLSTATRERAKPRSVYILRPLPESAPLVEDKERIVAHIPLDEYLRYAGGGVLPEESIEPVDDLLEDAEIELPLDRELSEKLGEAGVVLSQLKIGRLRTLIREGVPIQAKKLELRPECGRRGRCPQCAPRRGARPGRGDARADSRSLQGLEAPISARLPLAGDTGRRLPSQPSGRK